MDLVWPLTTSYDVENFDGVTTVRVPVFVCEVFGEIRRTMNTMKYNRLKSRVVFIMQSWRLTFDEFGHSAKDKLHNYVCFASRKKLRKIVFRSVYADNAPTDSTALTIIAVINELLPLPIAEEIIPHLVMSLRTLTAQ